MSYAWNAALLEWWMDPDVTENKKNGPETRADDIKSDEYDRNNKGESAG